MVDINRIHFANFFKIFTDPNDMERGELAFNSDMRLVYKDFDGVLHLLPSIDDYTNIYNPSTIEITQTTKDSIIGVGTEGNFSDKVTVAIPHSMIITATGINERQVLIQYDSNDNIKDILVLPEYLCRISTYTDILDVNQGIMTEYIKKDKIIAHIGRTEYENNAVFRICPIVDLPTFETTLGYTSTTESNKDNIEFRDRFYRHNGYLYLIKDKAVEDLDYPFTVFSIREEPMKVRVETKYFLFEQGDKFSIKTYRAFADGATAPDQRFISSTETGVITEIIQAHKITPVRISSENLTISSDGKSVEGLDGESYYEIVVTTNENKLHPTLRYKILDITQGFFAYIYRVMKYISDNAAGTGGVFINGVTGRKYLFEYTYTALQDNIFNFTIPQEFYSSTTGDKVFLTYKGLNLEKDVDFTITPETRLITLNFALVEGDKINAIIFKYADRGNEALLISSLQNYVNNINTELNNTKLLMNQMMIESPKTNILPDSGRFAGINYPGVTFPQHSRNIPSDVEADGGLMFTSYNNSVITGVGKFIHDNTTFGGSAGALTDTVVDLINTFPSRRLGTGTKRYGTEFMVLQVVAGNGTDSPYLSRYLMTINSLFNIGGNRYLTMSFWIRKTAGSNPLIRALSSEFPLILNGIKRPVGSNIELTDEMGWVHIESTIINNNGYDNGRPYIYGTQGTTIHVALPVVVLGKYGVGVHECPLICP